MRGATLASGGKREEAPLQARELAGLAELLCQWLKPANWGGMQQTKWHMAALPRQPQQSQREIAR